MYYDIVSNPILQYNGRIDSILHVQSSRHPLDALVLFGPFLAIHLRFQQAQLLIDCHLRQKIQYFLSKVFALFITPLYDNSFSRSLTE